MGRKDASTARTPVDQYRKQIGKQDYKKTRPMLRATRLKAEAKKTALGVKGSSQDLLFTHAEVEVFFRKVTSKHTFLRCLALKDSQPWKLPLSLQLYWYFCWLSMLSFILTFPMKLTLIWIQMKTSRCNESIIKISSAGTRLHRNAEPLHCETINDAISCGPNSKENFAICQSLSHSRSPKHGKNTCT
ncbi:triple QxxK/R motif-containing protein isoform X3 [Struthio camelus]